LRDLRNWNVDWICGVILPGHTIAGNAARTRTQTVCCVNSFQRAWISVQSSNYWSLNRYTNISYWKFSVFEERTEQTFLRSSMSQRPAKDGRQMNHILRNKIGQVGVLAPVPDLLDGVKFWSVGWQPFDVYPNRKTFLQPTGGRPMHHPAIPHQNDSPWKVAQHSGHEWLRFVGRDIMVEQFEVQPQSPTLRREANRRDNRQSITSVPAIVDRRLASDTPGTADRRLEHKAAFIDENNGFTAFLGFFLYAANRSCARRQWPVRCAPSLGVRVSGNSSPSDAAHAIRRTDRTLRRNACESPRPPAAVSIRRWHNRAFAAPATTAHSACRIADPSVWAWDRDGAWLSTPGARGDRKASSTSRWSRAKRPTFEPPEWADVRPAATRWLETVAVGALVVFRVFSCKRLSAIIGSFL